MRDLVVVALILFLYFLSMRSAYSACLMYWWFNIFRPQDWVWSDLSAFQLPFLATVIFFVVSFLKGYRPKVNDKLMFMMIGFWLLGTFASILYGCSSDFQSVEPIKHLSLLFIALFLTIDIVKTKKQLFGLVCVVALSLAFYTGKGGISAILSGGAVRYGVDNLGGMFSGSNGYAMGTAILLFFMVFIFRHADSFKEINWIPSFIKNRTYLIKGFMALMIIGSIFNVISLFSRASAIALACGFFVLYLLSNKKLQVFVIVLPILFILASTVPIPDGYKDRIRSAFAETEELDESALSRPYYWKIATEIVRDHPTGVGLNCYRQYYNNYSNERFGVSRDVHSSHFNAFTDAGYAGILVWFMLFFVSLTRLFSFRRLLNKHRTNLVNYSFYYHLCDAAIAAQIVYLLGGSFYTLTYMDLIWWIWGLTIILERLIKQEVEVTTDPETKSKLHGTL